MSERVNYNLTAVVAIAVGLAGCPLVWLLVILGCWMAADITAKAQTRQPIAAEAAPVAPRNADDERGARGRVSPFGEAVRLGELTVKVERISNRDQVGAYTGGLRIFYTVENTSSGKIHEWAGWQGKARVTDEHGNVFPENRSELRDYLDPDYRRGIEPGKTIRRCLIYVGLPPTSKQIFISVPLGKETITFSGPVPPPVIRR